MIKIRLRNALPGIVEYVAGNTLKQTGKTIAYGLAFGSTRGRLPQQGYEKKSHRLDGWAEPEYDCFDDESLLKQRIVTPYRGHTDLRVEQPISSLILRNPSSGDIVEFIDCVLSVSQTNAIAETALINKTGKVKELIQADDYVINVSGNLMYNGVGVAFPMEELKQAAKVLKTQESLDISSVILSGLGITKVVTKKTEFDQQAATHFNILPFSFEFCSDFDYDFLII